MINCTKICSLLAHNLSAQVLPVRIHSKFRNAINLTTAHGLVTVLTAGKSLQPYALVLAEPVDLDEFPEQGLTISRAGIWGGGTMLISLQIAAVINLHLGKLPKMQHRTAELLAAFLEDKQEQGLVALAFEQSSNVYVDFLKPRIAEFRTAMQAQDIQHAVNCAARIAGCGPGLTPSADDLLCGYLACLPYDLAQASAQRIAESAAGKTNDISAALLHKAGFGYFSEDILALIHCLCQNSAAAKLQLALQKVANFGSSSGCDFLVGMYFSLLDFDENGGR